MSEELLRENLRELKLRYGTMRRERDDLMAANVLVSQEIDALKAENAKLTAERNDARATCLHSLKVASAINDKLTAENARLNTVLAEVAKDYAIDDKMSKKYYAEMIKLRGENKKLQDEIIKIKSTMSNKLINAELDITRLQAERDMLMKNLQYHIDGACQCRACEIAREELKS